MDRNEQQLTDLYNKVKKLQLECKAREGEKSELDARLNIANDAQKRAETELTEARRQSDEAVALAERRREEHEKDRASHEADRKEIRAKHEAEYTEFKRLQVETREHQQHAYELALKKAKRQHQEDLAKTERQHEEKLAAAHAHTKRLEEELCTANRKRKELDTRLDNIVAEAQKRPSP
jgi:chromosome segregation ATPase